MKEREERTNNFQKLWIRKTGLSLSFQIEFKIEEKIRNDVSLLSRIGVLIILSTCKSVGEDL